MLVEVSVEFIYFNSGSFTSFGSAADERTRNKLSDEFIYLATRIAQQWTVDYRTRKKLSTYILRLVWLGSR